MSESIAVEPGAPDATPGKILAQLTFYENEDGVMAIEANHVGEFDAQNQGHKLLAIICDMLPQIVQPVSQEQFAAVTHQAPGAPQ